MEQSLFSKRFGKKTVIIVAVTVIALFGLWRILAGSESNNDSSLLAPASTESLSAEVITVRSQSIQMGQGATGTVQPQLQADISPKITGRIDQIFVHEGDAVHSGELLALLGSHDLQASVSQAGADLKASDSGYSSALIAAKLEAANSSAQISLARAQLKQSESALQAAKARRDLVEAGPRAQEKIQAALAVARAKADLNLAEQDAHRMAALYSQGAISAQQDDMYNNRFLVAQAAYDSAKQSYSISQEGSRSEEKRQAEDNVQQAVAAVAQSRAALEQARAAAMKVPLRQQEAKGAYARIGQSAAALQLAEVMQNYAKVTAPFDGVVTRRLADPGSLAVPGTPILQVQGRILRLDVSLPESDLHLAHLGQHVPIYMDALNGKEVNGLVTEIAPQGDGSSHTFTVKLTLPVNCGAKAGMYGHAQFPNGFEKTLLIPASSTWEREGIHYLYALDSDNIAHLRMITVGNPTPDGIPVLSGLMSGERILQNGGSGEIKDGVKINREEGR